MFFWFLKVWCKSCIIFPICISIILGLECFDLRYNNEISKVNLFLTTKLWSIKSKFHCIFLIFSNWPMNFATTTLNSGCAFWEPTWTASENTPTNLAAANYTGCSPAWWPEDPGGPSKRESTSPRKTRPRVRKSKTMHKDTSDKSPTFWPLSIGKWYSFSRPTTF